MLRSQRRLLALAVSIVLVLLVTAQLYVLGMRHLEGQERSFLRALGWASETLSTTGYGADAVWTHPAMVLLAVLLQFAGVFLVVSVFPIYIVPFLEERFEARLPTTARRLTGHLVIYRWGPAVASLAEEAEHRGVPVLVIEEEPATARRILERNVNVLFGRLADGALERASLATARAIVANGSDDANAAVALTARHLGFQGEILALVEEPFHRKPLLLAGATHVYTPRHILGAALAARASERISPRLSGLQELGDRLRIAEVRVERGSPLGGRTLAEAELATRTGATVLGLWRGGELEAAAGPRTRIEAGTILVALGEPEALERLGAACGRQRVLGERGTFVVGGCGEVGAKVVELLRDAGESVLVIDRRGGPGVDVAGNLLDPRVIEGAGLDRAQAVILALDTDTATLFATVIVRELAPELPVIARVNDAENVERIHRAGADFALSIAQVSGQMLAHRILGQSAVSVGPRLRVLRIGARGLAGEDLARLRIRERTGCSVVAVERNAKLITDVAPPFRFAGGDTAYVCGSADATHRFLDAFPQPAGAGTTG